MKTIDPQTGKVQLEAVPTSPASLWRLELHGRLNSGESLLGVVTKDRQEYFLKAGHKVFWPISKLCKAQQVELLPNYFVYERIFLIWEVHIEELPL